MKRILFISTAVMASLQLFAQSISVTPQKATIENNSIAAEEAAIIAVNEKQMTAFITHDYQAEAEVWSQEPYIVHYESAGPNVGWEAISANYKTIFNPGLEGGVVYHSMTASNYDIHINGNVAFVFCDQHQEYTVDGERKADSHRELKYFEKKDGQWKVIVVIPIN